MESWTLALRDFLQDKSRLYFNENMNIILFPLTVLSRVTLKL